MLFVLGKKTLRRSVPEMEDVYTPNAAFAAIVPVRIEAKPFFQLSYFLNFENVLWLPIMY